jgi:transposase
MKELAGHADGPPLFGLLPILSQKEKPMRPAATRPHVPSTLYLAFELGNSEWVLAMTTQMDQPPLRREMPARALKTLDVELARAKAHFDLPRSAPVRSCYEAGRDGFWLHRYLVSRGIINRIVDSSSIEVNRRRRRTKTDRLDAAKLVTMPDARRGR